MQMLDMKDELNKIFILVYYLQCNIIQGSKFQVIYDADNTPWIYIDSVHNDGQLDSVIMTKAPPVWVWSSSI